MTNLKPGVVLTLEFRILRLLSTVSGTVGLPSVESIKGFESGTLEKMKGDGLVQFTENLVNITSDGKKRFEELKPKFYRFV